jgi:Zn ribbon nucleic-acid-binding protein
MIRRFAWQGYRVLYKRKCDKSGDMVISTIHPNSPHKVYRQDIWWSDAWDPKSYGRDYDFSRPFFEQFRELFREVPLPSLMTEYSRLINSEYSNAATDLKNCYLCFRTTKGEDSAYLNVIVDARNSFDISYSNFIELSYNSIGLQKCYQTFYSQDCENCHDIWFSKDLAGCSNCIGCVNLRNKNYYIFNQPYTPEAYEAEKKKLGFGSAAFVKEFSEKVGTFIKSQPKRFMHGSKNTDVTGDYIYNSKNVHDSFMTRNAENVRYSQFLKVGPTANCYDYSVFSDGAEWVYDSCWVGLNINNVRFSVWDYRCHDIEYCFGCMSSGNLFGCVGIRSGEYCILNKQYSKEEYEKLVKLIKEQMTEMPYKDSLGRMYGYGELFPNELCPWTYNETYADTLQPLSKNDAIKSGFSWRDPDVHEYQPATATLPDHIKDITDDILKDILKCESCGKNYRLIEKELGFYRRFQIAAPRTCPMCRDRDRIHQLSPIALYDRTCSKCGNAIQTSYAPDRPEIVYCEACYQAEVA